ncbi:MAG: PhoH family protein [Planctomycetes bacterium]|nr:PhoH family protein [Planctomycetota bacterium]
MHKSIELRDQEELRTFLGPRDVNLRALRERFGIDLVCRGHKLKIIGEPDAIEAAASAVGELLRHIRQGHPLDPEAAQRIVAGEAPAPPGAGRFPAVRPLQPRSAGQASYWERMATNAIVLVVGPAGTGKTFLAVAKAVEMLRAGRVRRIVLVRPAVEAGEKLGFLPGDLQAKVNPYLRPIHDALNDCLGFDQTQRYTEREIIEILPLAYMRGRTLAGSFIILDEAQNTTPKQMMMFLTRMGEDSHVVVTGDVTQIDLPPSEESGLVDALRRLEGIAGIAVARLGRADIVRHPLVQEIVDAYAADLPHEGPAAGGRSEKRPA